MCFVCRLQLESLLVELVLHLAGMMAHNIFSFKFATDGKIIELLLMLFMICFNSFYQILVLV